MRRSPRRLWFGAALAGGAALVLAAVIASRWVGVGVLRPWGMAEFAGGRLSVNVTPLDATDPRFRRVGSRTGVWPLAWTVGGEPRYLSLGVMFGPNTRGIPRMDPPDPGPRQRQAHWSALGVFYTQAMPQGRDFELVVWPAALVLAALGCPLLVAGVRERRRRRSGHCPRCAYDLRSLAPGSACPECGPAASPTHGG